MHTFVLYVMVLVVRRGNSASANVNPRPGGFMLVSFFLMVAIVAIISAIYFAGRENLIAAILLIAAISFFLAALIERQNERQEKDRALEEARFERGRHLPL